ncbi:hypothetical protein NIE88_00115 [Sporolactobacillus shoreicorticis]|uniref:SEFIR domain-containing protein n=1 Tax=Sporolactobacillus shoreicorticis TaxID=1923877 RepID=A0ABW5S471_9BACL|nr:hypothetical protein [Sporolactobacillus shoreicorticis]MCO7124194.1 hypothetical protein [Sporolactobacillus shoreicorticis]
MGSNAKTIKAFVSYSLDSPEHRAWVIDFTNKLGANGIDANEPYRHLKSNDDPKHPYHHYVILVLTENYANRANSFAKDVGFETLLSIPELRSGEYLPLFLITLMTCRCQ